MLGIESPDHLAIHASRGAIFEGFVITEVIKSFYAEAKRAPIYYWREHAGLEIDLLIEKSNQMIAIEAKSGMTINSDQLLGLQKIQNIITDFSLLSLLVYGGDMTRKMNDINIISWKNFISYINI